MKIVDATDIRRNFAELADQVRHSGQGLIVHRNGRPLVAIMPVEEARRLDATCAAKKPAKIDRAAIERLIARTSARPILDNRSDEELLGYGDDGLPE
jgi:prevent-host-death family protein